MMINGLHCDDIPSADVFFIKFLVMVEHAGAFIAERSGVVLRARRDFFYIVASANSGNVFTSRADRISFRC
ncbi:MAG: hypothetical protein ABI876_16200, partial [Bacteroidota bacterium]